MSDEAAGDVVAEQTVELRAEAKEAYAAWQADVDDYELEGEYFDKLDRLDHNLAERGLGRGDELDAELPLNEVLGRDHTQSDELDLGY
jgi:hypothetical protein